MSLTSFSEPFIRRPVGTTLLAVGLLLVGVVAYRFLPVASMPTVDYPDHQRHRQPAGRRPRDHGGDGRGAARAPARRNPGRDRADLAQLARHDPHLGAVRSQPQHRRRRARRAGRHQCRADRPAGRPAVAAVVPQVQSGGDADHDPGAHLEHRAGERALRRGRHRDRPAPVAGRRRRRGHRQRRRAAGDPRPRQSGRARLDGARAGGRAHRHRQFQRDRTDRHLRRQRARDHHRQPTISCAPRRTTTRSWCAAPTARWCGCPRSPRSRRACATAAPPAGSTASPRCCW